MHTPQPNPLIAKFADALGSAWRSVARAEQLPPEGDWLIWLLMAGRGFGKTRTGSETTHEAVAAGARYLHLIAPTAADCRDVLVEGPAGLIATAASHSRPIYQPSLRKVVWPNGAQALLFSADEPDRLRGPQCEFLWIDELAAMRQAQEILDMAMFGLRLGKHPHCVITTTPRPLKCIKALLARAGADVAITRGSTYDNRANLAANFFQQVISKHEGTRLGRQEIYAEVLTDTPGALWQLERIEELRVSLA
jgi:phage terminase large subunit-like protein